MSYNLIKKIGETSWVKLSGKLTVYDFQELQALARINLELFGRFRVLVELEDFQGWNREPGWENTQFLIAHGDQVSRIAFVGNEKWKDDIFMFTGQPFREDEIEFFPPERIAEAQAWLSE